MANKKESNKESFKEKVGSGISNVLLFIGTMFVILAIAGLVIYVPILLLLIVGISIIVFVITALIRDKKNKKNNNTN